MKILFLIVSVLYTGYSFAQLNIEQSKIVGLELSMYEPLFIKKKPNTLVDDSLVVANTVYTSFLPNYTELKLWCLNRQYITIQESEDIFGKMPDEEYKKPEHNMWSNSDFPGHKVFLFDKNIHAVYGTSLSKKQGTGQPLHLAYPTIKIDGKYALVESYSELYGGILSIYKYTDGQWQLYKLIELYIT